MSQQSEITQEKILNILMKDQDILGEFLKHKNAVDLFDNSYRMLFDAMVHSHSLSVLLTKDSYKEFVKKQTQNNKLKTISEEQIFVKIHSLTIADKNDYPVLLDALLEQHSKNKIRDFFDKFQKEKDKNYKNAIRNLHINLDNLISEPSSGKYQILDLSSYFDDWYKGLVEKRENPQKRLLTGIKEIDESMQTGLTNGQLTLFVAEPGGMKSMMMMNIALNIFMNSGESVVFISLEMTKDKVMNRIISRETNIDLKKISQPDLLSSEELESVKNAHKKWSEKMNRFILIDNEERMTVSDIRRIVEKYHSTFKFKVLFIDYMAILQPDEKYLKQNEYAWPGEMCKDLRQMGRKFEFSIISAVQLGKEALKRLKQQKQANKTAGVEDMKGSHDYSADADNIYIQWPHPQEPVQKLCVVCAKARDGKKTFIGDAMMAVLEIKPHMQKIGSDNLWKIGSADEVNDVMHKKYGGDIPDLDNLDKDISEKPLNAKKIISTKASKVSDISFLDD